MEIQAIPTAGLDESTKALERIIRGSAPGWSAEERRVRAELAVAKRERERSEARVSALLDELEALP